MRTALEWVKEAAFFGLKPYDKVAQTNGRMVALDKTAPMERRVEGLGTFLWQSWRAALDTLPYDSPQASTYGYAAHVLSRRPGWLPQDVYAAFMDLHCLKSASPVAEHAAMSVSDADADADASTRSIKDALFLAMSANGGRWLVAPLRYAQARGAGKSAAKVELNMLCELGVLATAGNGQYHVLKSRYDLLP